MREFDEHGEPVKPPKKKRFSLFWNYSKDGKGVKKEDIITDYNFINFFKLYARKFTRLVWVNALYIVGNFPIFFLLLSISGFFSEAGAAPASEVFPVISGIQTASGEFSPSMSALLGIHGAMTTIYAPTTATYILRGLAALIIFTFGPVNAGCTYLVKNLVKGEPVFLWQDFKSTIKTSWKQSLPFGILDVLMIGLCFFSLYSYYYNYSRYYVLFYCMLIVIMLYSFMRFYIYTIMVTFELSLPKIIKNAAIFSILGFGRNFIMFLGIVMLIGLTLSLASIFIPLGVISVFMILFSTCAFMGMYAAYPKIKKYMIDPYYSGDEDMDISEPESEKD